MNETSRVKGIQFDESLLGVWYIEVRSDMNWLCGLSRTATPGRLQVKYRTRYFSPDATRDGRYDSDAEASWSFVEGAKSVEEFVAATREISRSMMQYAEGELFEVLRGDRTFEEFMAELVEQPFWAVSPDGVMQAHPSPSRG